MTDRFKHTDECYATNVNRKMGGKEPLCECGGVQVAAARAEGRRAGIEEAALLIEAQGYHSDFSLSMKGADKLMAAKVRALLSGGK